MVRRVREDFENLPESEYDLYCECCDKDLPERVVSKDNFVAPSDLPSGYNYKGDGGYLFCDSCLDNYEAGYLRFQLEKWRREGSRNIDEELLEALESERGFDEEDYKYWLNGNLKEIK